MNKNLLTDTPSCVKITSKRFQKLEAHLVRRLINSLCIVVFLFTATAIAQTQTAVSQNNVNHAVANQPLSPASQALAASLQNLPDADMLVFINPQRVLNDLLPKILPAKDVDQMRKDFDEAKKQAGVDPGKIEYVVIAVRFQKPTADLNFQAPQAMVVASGDISADSLMVLARMASQGKLREEKYGNRTLGLMTIDPIAKEAAKNPMLRGFSEVAVVPLTANTIAAGTPGYLRAAIDANDGKDRISTETLNSLVRDPNVLLSIAGRPWHSFAKSFGMLGTETTTRTPRCDTKVGDFYAALTMDNNNFMLRGAMNEDNPDTAKIVSNLFTGLMGYATSSLKDPMALGLLKSLVIAPEGDEVMIRGDFPQQTVINMIKEQMKPKQEPPTSQPAAKPTTPTKRRTRRRG